MADVILGIDLGTTNSLVAVVEAGRPRVLTVDGGPLLPSVVGIDEQGQRLVGHAARNQYVAAPERTVRSIKRQMGKSDYRAPLGEASYTPEEISSWILRRLAEAASAELGADVRRAVITIPAYFSDRQRQATLRAGELAGLEVVRLLHEPTAAALVYGLQRSDAETTLVYDLGGGTFDVSVVELDQGITEVRASHGNRELGGDDFDALIVEYLAQQFERQHHVDLRTDRLAMSRVVRAAEAAKIRLSDHPYAEIREEFLVTQGGKPLHLEAELSRERFEEMIEPLLAGTVESVRRALKESGVDARALDEVLLVGGSTRIPRVRELIAEELRHDPRQDLDPDEAVALGAAVQAAVIAGHGVDAVLVDVCPHSLGIRTLGIRAGDESDDVFVPIIRRNTAIPVSRSERFYTVHPDQDTVAVKVYQGEEPTATRNTHLGELMFRDLAEDPDGGLREVLVAFDYDINGILHVAAVDRRTGRREEMHLHTAALTEVAASGSSLPPEAAALLAKLRALQPRLAGSPDAAGLDQLIAQAETVGGGSGAEGLAAWQEAAGGFLFEHSPEY